MNPWIRRSTILLLFAALVLLLLRFQGILFRPAPASARIAAPARLAAGADTAIVESRSLTRHEIHPGFVEAVDPAPLAARVAAMVLEVAVREGEEVEAGRVLVRLERRDAEARAAQARAGVEAARAEAERAAAAHARAERLLAAEAMTAQDGESARAAHDAAQALLAQAGQSLAEAEAALAWYELSAPFAGRVLARSADPGRLALPGEALLTLYRPDALRLAVGVPAERAAGLAPGSAFEVELEGLPARTAWLERALPDADRASGNVILRLRLDPDPALRPGLLGRLRLPTGAREALLIPVAAVQQVGQIERVLLVQDGELLPTPVRLGKRHGDQVEVLGGLAAGERVALP